MDVVVRPSGCRCELARVSASPESPSWTHTPFCSSVLLPWSPKTLFFTARVSSLQSQSISLQIVPLHFPKVCVSPCWTPFGQARLGQARVSVVNPVQARFRTSDLRPLLVVYAAAAVVTVARLFFLFAFRFVFLRSPLPSSTEATAVAVQFVLLLLFKEILIFLKLTPQNNKVLLDLLKRKTMKLLRSLAAPAAATAVLSRGKRLRNSTNAIATPADDAATNRRRNRRKSREGRCYRHWGCPAQADEVPFNNPSSSFFFENWIEFQKGLLPARTPLGQKPRRHFYDFCSKKSAATASDTTAIAVAIASYCGQE